VVWVLFCWIERAACVSTAPVPHSTGSTCPKRKGVGVKTVCGVCDVGVLICDLYGEDVEVGRESTLGFILPCGSIARVYMYNGPILRKLQASKVHFG
jgi:hypothetical protein